MLSLSKRVILFLVLFLGLVPSGFSQADGILSHTLLVYSLSKNQSNLAEQPTVSVSALPLEAKHTLNLIKQGGPFPYPRDGITFNNREGRLPMHRQGYYREYTVKSPGSRDRGARRIIAGSRGELYYTDDHYKTFGQIKE
jgi:ribonuclease T1